MTRAALVTARLHAVTMTRRAASCPGGPSGLRGFGLMTGHYSGMQDLHRTVVDVVAAAGYDIEDAGSVRRLQAHHAHPGASVDDLAILTRRLERSNDLDHARLEGRHRRPSAAIIELDRIVLRALAPHLHELAEWVLQYRSGDDLDVIAARSRADPNVVRLALHGMAGRPASSDRADRLDRAGRLWRSGAPVFEVADALGQSTTGFRRARRSGRVALYPDRLSRGDIADRAGVAVLRVASWARSGILPAPDGVDGRPWWWEPTVTAWIEEALPYRCRHCSARMPTLTGVRVHTTKKHALRSETDPAHTRAAERTGH